MKEEFTKLAEAGKIKHGDVETLVTMATEGFCRHRSWGVGRITTVDTVLGKLTVDFSDKPGHSIDLGFAANILEPIAKENIEARKLTDLSGLKGMAAMDHLGVIKLIIDSYGDAATADKIQEVLVPGIIEEDYKKWWETARREMKKDGHYQIPTKKAEPIVYQTQEMPFQQRVLESFVSAKGLKARIVVAVEVAKGAADLDDAAAVGKETIQLLNSEIQSHARSKPGLALEAVFARDDIRAATGVETTEGEPEAATVWCQKPPLDELLVGLPVAKQRRALQSYQEFTADNWPADLLGVLNRVSSRLCGEIVQILAEAGKVEELKGTLARHINQHSAGTELLLWLAKDRSDTFAAVLGPEAFRAMITAIERESEKKVNKLRDFIIDDPELVDQLTQSADIDVVKDITRALQLSPSFEGMDRRSVLGKLVKSHPAIQSFITGDQSSREKDSSLVVSWPSLERRKEEYEEMVQRKIPANSKEIAIARSYGDLRENHEYKAAKEMQKVLMTRKGELEIDLERARGTDFADADTGQVSIGTRVTVTNLESNAREEFILLGAWDGDPDSNILSYLTPLGQALLTHKPGDEVTLDFEGDNRRFRIESITAHNTEVAAESEPEASAAQTESNPSEIEPVPATASGDEPTTPSV